MSIGKTLGHYRVVQELGRGGIGRSVEGAGRAPGPHGGDQEGQGAAQRALQAGRGLDYRAVGGRIEFESG
jgi:hypothetical protein